MACPFNRVGIAGQIYRNNGLIRLTGKEEPLNGVTTDTAVAEVSWFIYQLVV